MKGLVAFFLGLVLGLATPAVLVYSYFRFGLAPVATSALPMPFEKTAAKMALKARIDKQAPKTAPIPANEENFLAGAQVYQANCAVCHGQPGQTQSSIAKGMFPKPPHLFDDPITDDPPGQTYWKAANGIRMTGMPGFSTSLSDTQLWQVSLLLANADKLPQSVMAELSNPITQQRNPGRDSGDEWKRPQGSIAPKK